MSKQKSQVTMLMIVGLVLFIVVSFVLYLSKSAIKKQSQQNIKKVQETAIDVHPIKEFISNCLNRLAKDSVVLLGKQGGAIYDDQGGTLKRFDNTDEGIVFVKFNNLDVLYNIVPPIVPPVPEYPWLTFPYPTERSNSENFEGYFGGDRMPPLESSDGLYSFQEQIESFIDHNIQSCADFSFFRSQGYEITIETSKTHVSIGSSDISVKSEIPVKIINTATKETKQLNDFSAKIDLRLRDIYFFVKDIINKDTTDIKFNISDNKNNKDSININLLKNIFLDPDRKIKADLIVVTDGNSLIYGSPFKYIFARRNRAPALHYIRENNFTFPAGYLINESDILVEPLKAYDPDEDDVAFDIYVGEFGANEVQFPKRLDVEQLQFRAEVSDGALSDYQLITVNRATS